MSYVPVHRFDLKWMRKPEFAKTSGEPDAQRKVHVRFGEKAWETGGGDTAPRPRLTLLSGRETVSAVYATATLKTGNLEVIPGLRFEHTSIRNTYWVMAYSAGVEQPGAFASNRTSYNELLPSLFVNWRPNSTLVARGDVWFSYTRPPFFQLGGSSTARTGDDGKVTVVEGNPNLKPIRAINADASVEWNFAPAGHAMLGG
jgi:outer membrane receptor protein involved in Fe transport